MDQLGQKKVNKLLTSDKLHTVLSYKLEKQVNDFLEDNNAGKKVTIRSFSREVPYGIIMCE